MKIIKKTSLALLLILIVIQFIRPERNSGEIHSENDISHVVTVPDEIESILVKACYDCHSNKTDYPWYTNVQPVGWWMQHHVDEGKAELNFSEYKNYPFKKQKHMLHESAEMIEENSMPIDSYLWTHSQAKLTQEEKELFIRWSKSAMVELKNKQ